MNLNIIRSDRPESPTDFIFLYLGIIAGALWIYANMVQKEIVSLGIMAGLLGSLKAIKIGSDFQKKRKAEVENGQPANPAAGQ